MGLYDPPFSFERMWELFFFLSMLEVLFAPLRLQGL